MDDQLKKKFEIVKEDSDEIIKFLDSKVNENNTYFNDKTQFNMLIANLTP